MKIKILALVLSLLIMLPSVSAMAESDLASAKAQGLVGERPDGLVGAIPDSIDTETLQMMNQVNADRTAKYKSIAEKNGTPVDQVQALAGAKLIGQTPPGQYIMNAAGQWQKK